MKHDDQEFLSGLMDGEWHSLDIRSSIGRVCEDETLRAKWSRYHLARQAMREKTAVPGGSLAERVAAAIAEEPTYSNVTAIGGVGAGVPDTDAAPSDAVTGEPARAGAPAATEAVDDGWPAAEVSASGTGEGTVSGAGASGAVPRAATARTFAAGFGLAASVAVVTALGLNSLDGGAPVPETGVPGPTRVVASGAPATVGVDPFSLQLPGAPLPNVSLVANTAPSGAYWTDADSSARRGDSEERLNMFLSQHIENSPTSERQGMLPYSRLVGYVERGSAAGNAPAPVRPDGSAPER